jgi:arginase
MKPKFRLLETANGGADADAPPCYKKPMPIGLIGVPFNSAGVSGGEARSPAALRAAGLLEALQRVADIHDYGDIALPESSPQRDPASGIIAPVNLKKMVGAVRSQVTGAISRGDVPLVIGGECPLLLGCLAAARDAYGRVGLLFVDGHEDAWPPHQSTTGEAADMELGFALGLTATGVHDLDALLPLVRPDDTIVLGPRDRDELTVVNVPSIASTVTFRDDRALLAVDLATTSNVLTRQLHAAAAHWWFHLDLDVLATESFAAIRYPQPGGLSWPELETVTMAALQTPGLAGWNITIYNPDLDPDGSGAARIVSFLERMLEHQP